MPVAGDKETAASFLPDAGGDPNSDALRSRAVRRRKRDKVDDPTRQFVKCLLP